MLLRGYRFEHPKTEKSVTVRGWSYLWAGLLGAGYVWWIGYGNIWRALAMNIAYGMSFLAVVVATFYVPAKTQFLVLLPLTPAVVLAQGISMINIIRQGFRRRGWMSSLA